MNFNRLLITTLVCIICSTFCAQTKKNDPIGLIYNDSINNLPQLSKEFYANINSMNRTYDYELQNKKQRLKMRANEIQILGALAFVGTCVTITIIGTTQEWSEWVTVPCSVLGSFAIVPPFTIWAKKTRQKADAIDVSTTYILPMNEDISVGVSHFRNKYEQAYNGWGISVKATF